MKDTKLRIEYLTWVKNLSRELREFKKHAPCFNLTASSVAVPIELFSNHIKMGLSREALEEPDPWYNPKLVERISLIEGVDPDNILITNGASGAIFLVCRTILENGDHVIVEYPCYEPLIALPEFMGTDVSLLYRRVENGFNVDLDGLDSIMSERTRLIILTNLHNPSGVYLREDELLGIQAVARKYNSKVRILVDEVYHRFIDTNVQPAAKLNEGFISINSLSKVYGLYILRCGWITADSDFIDAVRRIFVLTENIGSPLNESIASVVLEYEEEYYRHSQTILNQNRKILKESVQPLLEEGLLEGNIPESGCICFPKLTGINNTEGFTKVFAEKQNVYVVPGHFFGLPQHVRLGFGGNTEELRIGLERFGRELRRLGV